VFAVGGHVLVTTLVLFMTERTHRPIAQGYLNHYHPHTLRRRNGRRRRQHRLVLNRLRQRTRPLAEFDRMIETDGDCKDARHPTRAVSRAFDKAGIQIVAPASANA